MELSSTFKNPACSKVWIDGYFLCWQVDREKKIELTKNFLKELATMVISKETLIGLFEHYGPLWKGGKIFLESAFSMIRAYQLLWILSKGAKEIGQPAQAKVLMERFFTPLEHWEHNWPLTGYFILPAVSMNRFESNVEEIIKKAHKIEEVVALAVNDKKSGLPPRSIKFKLFLAVTESGQTQFLPIEPSPEQWPLFDILPKITNWEKRKEWLHKQLMKNVISLLRDEINLSLIDRNGSIQVTARPASAFAWAIGRMVLEKASRCICGTLTGGSRYCSRSCEITAMSTGSKQAFLDYLNKQVKRDRITSEEHVFIKEYLSRVFKPGDSEAKLLKKVLNALAKKYTDRDFSFLLGFGSRRTAQKQRRGK